MKRLLFIVSSCLCLYETIQAQNISNIYPYAFSLKHAEYFIDSDPGLGKGMNIPITEGDSLDLNGITHNVNGLIAGSHLLCVRVCDSVGKWGIASRYPFWISDTSKTIKSIKNVYPYAHSLKRVEYFIDNDPGLGKGTDIPIIEGDSVALDNLSYVANGLSKGTHLLCVRARDSLGKWGVALTSPFWVLDTAKKTNQVKNLYPYSHPIKRAEYFIDSDPGLGKGINIPITMGDSVALNDINYNVSGLISGSHLLCVRVCDSIGHWGVASRYPFWVSDTTLMKHNPLPSPKISKLMNAEYYIGLADPGYGNGIPFTFDPDTAITIDTSHLENNFSEGLHYFSYRVKSAQGFWSVTERFTFEVCLNHPSFPATVSSGAICGGSGTVTLTASGTKNKKYAWYDESWGGTALSSLSDSTFTTPVLTSSRVYYVAEIGATCNGPRKPADVTVYQTLPKPISSSYIRCGAGTIQLESSQIVPGTTLRWYTSDTISQHFAEGDTITSDTIPATTIIYASTITLDGSCESPDKAGFFLEVKTCDDQTIDFPEIKNQVYQEDPPIKLGASATSGLPISYTYVGPCKIYNDTLETTGTGDITVCAHQPGSVASNYNAAPTVCQTFKSSNSRLDIQISYNTPLCSGGELRLITTEVIGAEYHWSGPNGFVSTEKSPNIYNVSLSDSGRYSLVVYVVKDTSISNLNDTLLSNIKVKVHQSPQTIYLFSKQESKCAKEYTLFTDGDNINTYQWYYNAKVLTGQTDSNYVPSSTGVYSVTGYNHAGCAISSQPLYVNIDPDTIPEIIRIPNPDRLSTSPYEKYQWFVDGYYIANSNKREIPLVFNGQYKVKVMDAKNCEKFSEPYYVNDNQLVHLKSANLNSFGQLDLEQLSSLTVFPNPVKDEARLEWLSNFKGEFEIRMVDTQGNLVYKEFAHKDSDYFLRNLSTSSLPKGLYVLYLQRGNQVKIVKFAVER